MALQAELLAAEHHAVLERKLAILHNAQLAILAARPVAGLALNAVLDLELPLEELLLLRRCEIPPCDVTLETLRALHRRLRQAEFLGNLQGLVRLQHLVSFRVTRVLPDGKLLALLLQLAAQLS